MGHCFSCCFRKPLSTLTRNELSIKLPHGLSYIYYCDEAKTFMKSESNSDINSWIKNLYANSDWKNWIVYNDQIEVIGFKHTTKGHCKGIVAWNDKNISWLCHSTPNFPKYFNGNEISDLESNEHMYGQIYQYIEIPFNNSILNDILSQIDIMDANVYMEKYDKPIYFNKDDDIKIRKIQLHNDIEHVAKSPCYEIDIYSEYLAHEFPHKWYVETWIRGHHIEKTCDKIIDIKDIQFQDIKYTEKQDHSKWAVSDKDLYWVGDLNRMTSQYKRGGGGFIIKNMDISESFRNKLINDLFNKLTIIK